MRYDEFIAQVQHRAGLGSRQEAERAIRATLETLAERLAGGEPKDLAAQLPPEIGAYLRGPLAGAADDFSLDEFFQLVSQREGVAPAEATYHARVILALVSEVVTMGEIENVRAQLPADFRQLFEVENEGQVPGQGVIDESVIDEQATQRPAPAAQQVQPPFVSDMGVDVDHPFPPTHIHTEAP